MRFRMRHLCFLLLLTLAPPVFAEAPERMPDGFQSLFNEEDLQGWVGGTTIDPAKITEEKQSEWDSQLAEHWRAEGDQIVSDGHGPHLVTAEQFGDFELWVDWNLAPKGDSGIYLRDCPQVQIWDPTNEAAHKHGSEKGSGGLWNNQKHERWPLVVADKPCGEWNRMYVRMVGPYVKVLLNDQLVVGDVVLENYFDREQGVPERGRIHLQTHGSETRFRRVWIRELDEDESADVLAEIGKQRDEE